MPEAPEVRFLAKYIKDRYQNKLLRSVKITRGRYLNHGAPPNFDAFTAALPIRLIDVQTKGKVTILSFEKGWHIVSKLGLMGWWYAEGDKPDWTGKTPHNLAFEFKSSKKLLYTDAASYGTMVFTQDIKDQFLRLAPEADKVTATELLLRAKKWGKNTMEDILVDQTKLVSGIGNYLKSEILYEAHISPKRLVQTISANDWVAFVTATKKVFRRMQRAMGKDEVSYVKSMKIYRKEYDPQGNKVQKYQAKNGRTTYWVPNVQT